MLSSVFGVADKQAIEILLCLRLNATVPSPWFILETNCYSLDFSASWFNLGRDDALALPQFRLPRPRQANQELAKLLAERSRPQLFLEPHFERPLAPHSKVTLWPYLLQSCLRLRTPYPKTTPATAPQLLRLAAAVDRALDSEFRIDCPARESLALPPWFLYYVELTQKASPYPRDWDTFVSQLLALVLRRAYLFNRQPDPSDWEAVIRVLSDTIPVWTGKILRQFHTTGRWHSIRGILPDRLVKQEVERLLAHGLIYTHRGEWLLREKETVGKDLVALVLNQVEL